MARYPFGFHARENAYSDFEAGPDDCVYTSRSKWRSIEESIKVKTIDLDASSQNERRGRGSVERTERCTRTKQERVRLAVLVTRRTTHLTRVQ